MAALYESKGFGPAKEFLAAAKHGALVSAVDPDAKDLEGYLFPDTYKLPRHATAEQLVARMVAGFMKALTAGSDRQAEARGLTVRRLVTLASIVEKETGNADERPRSPRSTRTGSRSAWACSAIPPSSTRWSAPGATTGT
jgi:UPF0755 protein